MSGADEPKLIEVVKGNPTDEDIAAIVAVVSAAVAPKEEGPKAPRDRWGIDTSRGTGASPNVPWAFPNVSHLRW
ncbi:acyl-CoA carboxylase epsilon subunit [Smaragdicoccus niigatensis]|uniref:acyl-CoA carboxylase epsilon subunit n=1 Tax=Smaragdicoccus niigatensis TaxID=359359 RepID=UPI0003825AA7|nr:acyl-CoA carboxylase epsilon subunit [Smaragdicoccus niigatensis]